ncbi:hypothetical protein H696_02203 [Fonticula alba]|uniref:Uncharacterized protein n=1 Tax=Fonticula alba TaxID=691883 RepID=A0A058ZBF7_FONAL|nr:hypothetical protein H696_02203 [Fonticula alba]KCV71253.1 hypothetical protein H696_02203 [Fonticula alba]|eukprot:XP_009494376.1 hypothetical protein H696_02203 [Fonticula alba]
MDLPVSNALSAVLSQPGNDGVLVSGPDGFCIHAAGKLAPEQSPFFSAAIDHSRRLAAIFNRTAGAGAPSAPSAVPVTLVVESDSGRTMVRQLSPQSGFTLALLRSRSPQHHHTAHVVPDAQAASVESSSPDTGESA